MAELLIVSPGSFMFWLLAVCAVVFTAVFIKKNKNRPENERRKAALILYGAGLVIYFLYKFALSRDTEYSRILLESGAFGFNWWEELPFQLCNITLLLLPVMYHHLNNYGTTSCVVTLGMVHREEIIGPSGEKSVRDILEIGATVDERIADGFYFSGSVKVLKAVIRHPELLFRPLAEKIPEDGEK